MIADTVRRFHAEAKLTNLLSGESAEARSVLSMIGLDVQRGHAVLLEANGDDEGELIAAVRVLVHERFGEHPDRVEHGAPGMHAGTTARAEIPEGLARLPLTVIAGRAISRGPWGTRWGGGDVGAVVVVGALALSDDDLACRTASPSVERGHYERAMRTVRDAIAARRAGATGGPAAEIVAAQQSILEDPVLRARVLELIDAGAPAPCAIVGAGRVLSAKLRASASQYIRERVNDVDEVCRELVRGVDPMLCPSGAPELSEPSVIFAASLGVSDLLGLEREKVVGLVVGTVGETSHVAILARAMQIATIACDEDPAVLVRAAGGATRAIVDAIGGCVILDPPARAEQYIARERVAREMLEATRRPLLREPGRTRDGMGMEVAANVASAAEAIEAMARGADGVGLFRTEMLFLDRAQPPSEDEQCAEYSATVRAVCDSGGKGVIFRTFDIGADKPAPYLNLPREDNPSLGVRGIRLYQRVPELIRAQIRAICRASASGAVRVMSPMVATLEEAKWFAGLVRDVQGELNAEGVAHDPEMSVGVMVEVPSLAATVSRLAGVVDFVSFGTNDLAQYLFAADRTSAAVSELNHPRQPALLSVLERAIRETRGAGLWVGVCGEMAADPVNLPLVVGMGAHEISVSSGAIAELKSQLRRLDSTECAVVVRHAVEAGSPTEVEVRLRQMPRESTAENPLTAETILLDQAFADKHEVIHALACAVAGAGRAADPRRLEADIWARERTYSTGVGFGVAIPHARSASVRTPTIGLCRLSTPVRWAADTSAEDDAKVTLAVLLCVPAEGDAQTGKMDAAHQRMLATLARKLMHEEFRDGLRGAGSADDVVGLLQASLTPKAN